MPIHKKEDIVGYETDRGIFCRECLPDGAKIQLVLTEETRDGDIIYICDRCKEQVWMPKDGGDHVYQAERS